MASELMALMYDSDDPRAIPADAQIVAGYIDGYAAGLWNGPQGWARFPNAIKVRISATGINDGDVLDVEPGNPNATYAAQWIRMRQAAGLARPVIYCGFSQAPGYSWADVQRACAGLEYDVWICHATGTPHLEPGSVATQYAMSSQSGGHYDLSITNDIWPGGDMTPQQLQEFLDGLARQVGGQTGIVSWMQDVLGTEQSNFNLENAIKAELHALKLEVDAAPADPKNAGMAAAVARIEAALKQA